MYDSKTEANEFVAESREEAVAKACSFYGLGEDDLRVVEAEDVSGAAGRAVVVAIPKGAPAPRSSSGERDGGRRREGRRDRNDRERDRNDRGRDRGGDRNRDRERGRGGENRAGRDRDSGAESRAAQDRQPAASVQDSKGTVEGEIGEIGEFLLGTVERMKLGPFELSESQEGDFLIFQLKGRAAEELGSGDGRVLDALQLLANQAAMRGDSPTRVVVDAEGNAERRESFLTRLAERAARRSMDTKRSVALDPMNARDRRILHMTVRDLDGVATMSVGSGRYRQVVIVPEGSPEYEEARVSSSAAAARDSELS